MKSFISYLIESSTINESYKDARNSFIRAGNDPDDVDAGLKDFKKLVDMQRVPQSERDITQWMKKPFDTLLRFVDSTKEQPSNKQSKKEVKGKSITLKTWGDWIALIPLTKGASCFYGKGTQWCTAATSSKNYFDSYFNKGITLVYFINKQTGIKYAAAVMTETKLDGEEVLKGEYFDQNDSHIFDEKTFAKYVGLSLDELHTILHTAIEHESVNTSRDNNRYEGLRKDADEILSAELDPDTAYYQYQEISTLLTNPFIERAVGDDKFNQLKAKQKEFYKVHISNYVNNALITIKRSREAIKKFPSSLPVQITSVLRSIDHLPDDYKEYTDPKTIQFIEQATKEFNKLRDDDSDELLRKLGQ